MNEISIIRGSEMQDFLRCRKRWNWRWNEGLKPKALNDKLFTGTLIHKYLEVLYNVWDHETAKTAMQELYQQSITEQMDQMMLQEIWELADGVTTHYAKHWSSQDAEMKTIATELEFMILLDAESGIVFTGTIDWVFEDADGHIWFSDHKTTSSIDKYEKNSHMDRQISRYWWALQQIAAGVGRVKNKETGMWEECQVLKDKVVYGFVYNIILKDIPKKPELLKKGGFSKAKNQKTTYELYCQALIDHIGSVAFESSDIVKEEYGEILEYLRNQENRYFKRVECFRTQEELEAAIWEFFYTAEDMTGLAAGLQLAKNPADLQIMELAGKNPRNKLYRNITSDCAWDCPFKSLCQAEIEGANTSFLLASSYTKETE